MNKNELIAKIKAEIERRKSLLTQHSKLTYDLILETFIKEYDDLLSFISTLESENPLGEEYAIEIGKYTHTLRIGSQSDIDNLIRQEKQEQPEVDLEKEYKEYVENDPVYRKLVNRNAGLSIARHFAEWGAEHLADARKTSPKDLEEAKEAYCEEHNDECFDACGSKCPHIRNAYIAGAKWQKEEDDKELSDLLTIAHLQGAEQMKEMMMKEAVEGEVCIPNVWVEHKEGKELVVRAEISKELGFKFGDKVRIIIVKENEV